MIAVYKPLAKPVMIYKLAQLYQLQLHLLKVAVKKISNHLILGLQF